MYSYIMCIFMYLLIYLLIYWHILLAYCFYFLFMELVFLYMQTNMKKKRIFNTGAQ